MTGSALSPQFRMLTIYVFPISLDFSEAGFRFVFLADAFNGEWPNRQRQWGPGVRAPTH